MFRSIYQNCSDVIFRSFLLFGKKKAMIIYIEGLSDIEGIENFVLIPFMQETGNETKPLNDLLEKEIPVSKVKKVRLVADCIESISNGNPILLIEGEMDGYSLGLANGKSGRLKNLLQKEELEDLGKGLMSHLV